MLSLGQYPEVTIKEARDNRDDFLKNLRDGIDPSVKRQAERNADGDTFKAVAEEWLAGQKNLSPGTVEQIRTRLTTYLYPKIGQHKIGTIEPTDLLKALRAVEAKGRHDTAHRCRSHAGRVFRYAIATGRAQRDHSADLRDALATVTTTHHAALTTPNEVGKLLVDIDAYAGFSSVMSALRLAPLVFVRPGELRGAEWSEIDLKAAEWRIPARRMKMKADHIVPLSRQAVAILREQHTITGAGRYVFPSVRTDDKPISENTINAALRGLGYTGNQMTGHGFRTTASTLLHELGFATDVIERQLAHTESNKTKAAYNRAAHLPERKRMMQRWADHLDKLRAAAVSESSK
jgi:integrase